MKKKLLIFISFLAFFSCSKKKEINAIDTLSKRGIHKIQFGKGVFEQNKISSLVDLFSDSNLLVASYADYYAYTKDNALHIEKFNQNK